jgi:hypothetical protein
MIVGDHEPDACCHPILPVLRRSVANGVKRDFMLSAKQFKRRMSTWRDDWSKPVPQELYSNPIRTNSRW